MLLLSQGRFNKQKQTVNSAKCEFFIRSSEILVEYKFYYKQNQVEMSELYCYHFNQTHLFIHVLLDTSTYSNIHTYKLYMKAKQKSFNVLFVPA